MPSPTVPPTSAKTVRLHYLDWLRVIAILIVFGYHAVHPFDMWGWHVKNIEQSLVLSITLTILSLWGMPFFFLVAGSAGWFALQRRTPNQYVSERIKRLLIPCIVTTILFYPLMLYFEWGNRLYLGTTTFSFADYFAKDWAFFVQLGINPMWFGIGRHLWFLGFLFAFALITLPLFLWLKRDNGARFLAWLASICEHRGGILLLALPSIAIRFCLQPFFPEEHNWSDFTYQMSFFILGYILYADERFARIIRRDGWLLFGSGTITLLAMFIMYAVGLPIFDWATNPAIPQFYLAHFLVGVIGFTYSLTMLFIGMRFLDFTNQWLKYAQEAVLPFFILHQPVIIVIAFYVVQWQMDLLPKLVIVVTSSFIVTVGIYEFIIRRIAPLRTIFGMTKMIAPAHAG
ncbi:MAG: acyltransferase family protein [Chloroflexi bacterium]|nr:acyltransferase family protein [Chloroflexota bacterium]